MNNELEDFLEHLRVERGLSHNTITAYKHDIHCFILFLNKKSFKVNWDKIKHDYISKYLFQIMKDGLSDSTRARRLASLKTFFSFLLEANIINIDPTEDIKSPRNISKLPARTPARRSTTLSSSDARGRNSTTASSNLQRPISRANPLGARLYFTKSERHRALTLYVSG